MLCDSCFDKSSLPTILRRCAGGRDRRPNKRIWQAEGVKVRKAVPKAGVQASNVLDILHNLTLEMDVST